MKLSLIAERLGCRLVGDPNLEITGVAGLDDAAKGQLTFLSNPRYSDRLASTKASAILLKDEDASLDLAQLVGADPYLGFARALELFYEAPRPAPGVHPTAVVADTAEVAPDATLGAYVVVGENVKIGPRAILHPHTTIYDGVQIGEDFLAHSHVSVREFCRIGDRVVLQNGVRLGTDGYGFARREDGSHHKIPQSGIVIVEDDVEIQAGSCIDRAAVGETRIRRGAKLDNMVQIGHAVEVGEDAIICSQVGIAGSTTLGKNCILAGQVGIINHLTIGDNVLITAQTGVGHDIESGRKISGSPELDNSQWLRCTAVYNRLPELSRDLRRIKKKLGV